MIWNIWYYFFEDWSWTDRFVYESSGLPDRLTNPTKSTIFTPLLWSKSITDICLEFEFLTKSKFSDVNWGNKMDDKGAYLIDRSPKYFLPLLDYLRNGEIVMDHNINYRGMLRSWYIRTSLPASLLHHSNILHHVYNYLGVLLEAKYFGFTDLIPKIEELIKITDKRNLEPLNRDDVVRALMATPSNYILRFRVGNCLLNHTTQSDIFCNIVFFRG